MKNVKNVRPLLFICESIVPMYERFKNLSLCFVNPTRPGGKSPPKPRFYQRRFAYTYKPVSYPNDIVMTIIKAERSEYNKNRFF